MSVGCLRLSLIPFIMLVINEDFVNIVDNDEVDGVVCISLTE